MLNIKTKLKINFFVFLLSFCVGILVVYLTTPQPEIIIKYPSINNAHKSIYKHDDKCYNFIPRQIECDN
jgi:hypothetical protein